MVVFLSIKQTLKLFLRVNSNLWKFVSTQLMFQCLADLNSISFANGPTYCSKNFLNKGMPNSSKIWASRSFVTARQRMWRSPKMGSFPSLCCLCLKRLRSCCQASIACTSRRKLTNYAGRIIRRQRKKRWFIANLRIQTAIRANKAARTTKSQRWLIWKTTKNEY